MSRFGRGRVVTRPLTNPPLARFSLMKSEMAEEWNSTQTELQEIFCKYLAFLFDNPPIEIGKFFTELAAEMAKDAYIAHTSYNPLERSLYEQHLEAWPKKALERVEAAHLKPSEKFSAATFKDVFEMNMGICCAFLRRFSVIRP